MTRGSLMARRERLMCLRRISAGLLKSKNAFAPRPAASSTVPSTEEVSPPSWLDSEGRVERVYAEVHLTPAQARRGGQVEIRIPLQVLCPACRGWGGRGRTVCARCAGRGQVATERPLALYLPGDIIEGDEARISLDQIGVPGVTLTIRFFVDGW